jgi:hypothetical protein
MLRKFLVLACLLSFGVGLLGAGSGCVYERGHDHWHHDDEGWHHDHDHDWH